MHFAKRTELRQYLRAAYKKCVQIHKKLPPGGILVFLTGKREIEHFVKKLRKRFSDKSISSGETGTNTCTNYEDSDSIADDTDDNKGDGSDMFRGLDADEAAGDNFGKGVDGEDENEDGSDWNSSDSDSAEEGEDSVERSIKGTDDSSDSDVGGEEKRITTPATANTATIEKKEEEISDAERVWLDAGLQGDVSLDMSCCVR